MASVDERVFKTLLLLDYFRGQDSTGVCIVGKKGGVDVLKVADDPIMLFQHQDYESLVVGVSDAIWIGHNRAATIGSTTRANAHPFQCRHITGVHNGTLEKSSFLELSARLKETYGTDSETIFQHMAVYGVEDTVSRLQGAWALVWYDEKERTLNMVKNDKRPLFTCTIERGGKKILTWASEFKMISAARHMADEKDGEIITDQGGYGFFPLEDDTLHTWTLEQILEGRDLTAIKIPMEGKPPAITSVPAFINNSCHVNSDKTGKSPKTASFSLIEDKYEVSEVYVEDSGLILGVMEPEEWDEISRFGCSCCGADVYPSDVGLVVYVNEGVVICPQCSEETETVVSNGFGMQLNDRIIG